MSNNQDHLSNEVSIEAELTERGVSAKAKSRALAAFDRLVGGILDVPAAHAEGKARRIRATTEAQVRLIEADASAAEAKMRSSLTAGDRALENFQRSQDRKQTNKDSIVREANEELKALPPPTEPEGGPDDLDSDWLNIFEQHAENASSDRLQKIWAQVLAGEIRAPGTFSLSTLRMISEIDQSIAQTFQKWTTRRWNGVIIRPEKLENVVLSELTFLDEVGLLQSTDGNVIRRLETPDDGQAFLAGQEFGLLIKAAPKTKLRFRVIPITRVGREIASILPSDETGAFRDIARELKKIAGTELHLCKITNRSSNNYGYVSIERL